ncbi:MAG: MerR family DNA-binding transcriptional regulator, partial [Anaerolineales bacterium]
MSTYKAAEFAKLAGVSVKTLQRWDREGRLKASSRTPG